MCFMLYRMQKLIQPHFVRFNEGVVDPVSLALKLPSLRNYDIEQIECNTKYSGRSHGVRRLYEAIVGKVKWPELYTALKKENLTDLAKILQNEYYRQNPTAQRSPEDENLNPSSANQCGQEPSDSSTFSNVHDRASATANIRVFTNSSSSDSSKVVDANLEKLVKDCGRLVIITQTLNLQCGDNNRMNTILNSDHDSIKTECEEQCEVCVESDDSESLNMNDNVWNNNTPITVLNSSLPTESATPQNLAPSPQNVTPSPQNVTPQVSSSSSDSQDGGSPKVRCTNETPGHTSAKLVFQESHGDERVYSAPSDDISLIMSERQGHSEIGGLISSESLGIAWRKGVKQSGEGDDGEETKLKKLI